MSRFVYDGPAGLWRPSRPYKLAIAASGVVVQPPAATAPGSVQAASATALVEGAQIVWTAPLSSGGSQITGYSIQNVLTGVTRTTSPADRSYQWTGLTVGTPLSFRVSAVNVVGVSTAVQTNSVTPVAAPGGSPPVGDIWWGWDSDSNDLPPLMTDWPWHNNTGLWRQQERDALVTVSSFASSSTNQIVRNRKITGDTTVTHAGVKFFHCWQMGKVLVSGAAVGAGAPSFIYSDNGETDPNRSPSDSNSGGAVRMYRCNTFGRRDGFWVKDEMIIQDCFLHDPCIAFDSGLNGRSHNDFFQIKGEGSGSADNILINHNTWWCWSFDQYTSGIDQTCTRSSGPNWIDRGDPISSGGRTTARNGSISDGYMTSGFMAPTGANGKNVRITNNLMRGHTAGYTNVGTTVTGGVVTGNRIATNEHQTGKTLMGWGASATWSDNRDYKSGALINKG